MGRQRIVVLSEDTETELSTETALICMKHSDQPESWTASYFADNLSDTLTLLMMSLASADALARELMSQYNVTAIQPIYPTINSTKKLAFSLLELYSKGREHEESKRDGTISPWLETESGENS